MRALELCVRVDERPVGVVHLVRGGGGGGDGDFFARLGVAQNLSLLVKPRSGRRRLLARGFRLAGQVRHRGARVVLRAHGGVVRRRRGVVVALRARQRVLRDLQLHEQLVNLPRRLVVALPRLRERRLRLLQARARVVQLALRALGGLSRLLRLGLERGQRGAVGRGGGGRRGALRPRLRGLGFDVRVGPRRERARGGFRR